MQKVLMYVMAGCPYCVNAERLLIDKGVNQIEKIRVDLDPEQKKKMIQITGRRTVPQIFIGETHVGGCDDLYALEESQGLEPLLAQ